MGFWGYDRWIIRYLEKGTVGIIGSYHNYLYSNTEKEVYLLKVQKTDDEAQKWKIIPANV
jgi:hypothetical protein